MIINNKPLLVLQAPLFSRSGYGDHSQDILRSIYELDRFDVKLVPTKWGSTPQNQVDGETEFGKRMLSEVITTLDRKPDVFIQISVANEFRPIGEYNIGITAGVETTLAPQEFIEGSNKMDLIIVPSEFTKEVLMKSSYNKIDSQTHLKVGELKVTKPIEVLFEGVDTTVFTNIPRVSDVLHGIDTEFNFLMVGHWLQGNEGEDRKDVGSLIRTFCTVFKNSPKKKQPGLILKTSTAGFGIGDREAIVTKIKKITKEFGNKCPSIHLLFGDLTHEEMNELYTHPKVKAMVMFTKGEGYGRPLAEFATTGKPILVSKWSGHMDFLPEENTVYLDGVLTPVHSSAQNKFILKDSKWFSVNYSYASQKMFDVHRNYDTYLTQSNGLKTNIKKNFTLDKMTEKLGEIFDKYTKKPQHIELQLPKLD